ncbi:MAG: transposase family protein [bacterium]|nr:MAG: transposase family protein [bacterium]KAF0163214.1 MAG: transposase family protein [bacterium]TNC93327.1 MAG: transposase IS116/IS110/IS902 family protein [Stygiobacter sp.]
MKTTTMGIDLAKSVFQLHGVDARGHEVVRRSLKRAQMRAYFARLEPCLIGMEACGSAHYWARELAALGHTVRLMAPQFVKPYVKSQKNDAADAEAICEAVARPNMRFVAVKTVDQQAVLALHRSRAGFVKARTAQANQMRGLLGEFGLVVPQGIASLYRTLPAILEEADNSLPGPMRALLRRLLEHLKGLDLQVAELEAEIVAWHRQNEASRALAEIPGIGPLGASALVASVGDVHGFARGRQMAAWLGLVPRQHSSGGKSVLLGITKRGDSYLRMLLIHGARAVIRAFERKANPPEGWLKRLLARRHKNVAAVALANKMARIAWAVLAHGDRFRPDYSAAGAA